MKPATTIRLLTSTTNQKGDLFTRLMKDLFYALSYEDIRLDVHKTGREIDIQGHHRYEARLLKAECKAHVSKMGGAELNKFFGALTRERKKAEEPVEGYFISLGGFTETGIDQELETGIDRIILLGPTQIIRQLEQSRVLADDTIVAERAGQCANRVGVGSAVASHIELLGHEMGYVKAVYYEHNKLLTHFALIHADGSPLAVDTAQIVIDADQASGGSLHQLKYLAPAPVERRVDEAEAMAHYRRWLGEECGYIYMDGLPTVSDASTTRLELERLFVPLRAFLPQKPSAEDAKNQPPVKLESKSIADLLNSAAHLALLAAPGGGKSTLLKRLATFYGFEGRDSGIGDDLPKRDWLPLFLRCRELRNRASHPILSLLEQLPTQANMPLEEGVVFRQIIHEALRAGKILLLIDGLDEIADEGDRKSFANNLRTFLAMFPQTTLIVTSREAGFRLVAGVIASICQHARLAPFEKEDVSRLCEAWHAQVVNDTMEVQRKALQLAEDIWDNERIRALSENPLLLTTLLVVNRWIGEVPKSRAMLYGKAVEVLVRTWNSEGFKALDEEETLAQLSYLACKMMENGDQQVTRSVLLQTLNEARQVLTAELRFTRISSAEFIKRVEYRSSLLMQTGSALIDGELQDVYEFRHLTFQEYLAARGYVEGHHPRSNDNISLSDVLTPNITDESWREVIPLALVLAKRNAQDTLGELLRLWNKTGLENYEIELVSSLICQCVLDEVTIVSPNVLEEFLTTASIVGDGVSFTDNFRLKVAQGKFGLLFREIVERKFIGGESYWEGHGSTLSDVIFYDLIESCAYKPQCIAQKAYMLLSDSSKLNKIKGLLAYSEIGFIVSNNIDPDDYEYMYGFDHWDYLLLDDEINNINKILYECLLMPDDQILYSVFWCLVWGPAFIGFTFLEQFPVMQKLLMFSHKASLTISTQFSRTNHYLEWTLKNLPLLERDGLCLDIGDNYFIGVELKDEQKYYENSHSSMLLIWYRFIPCSDEELVEIIDKVFKVNKYGRETTESEDAVFLLSRLNEAGRNKLIDREKRRDVALLEPEEDNDLPF